jgi:hypothetical protein
MGRPAGLKMTGFGVEMRDAGPSAALRSAEDDTFVAWVGRWGGDGLEAVQSCGLGLGGWVKGGGFEGVEFGAGLVVAVHVPDHYLLGVEGLGTGLGDLGLGSGELFAVAGEVGVHGVDAVLAGVKLLACLMKFRLNLVELVEVDGWGYVEGVGSGFGGGVGFVGGAGAELGDVAGLEGLHLLAEFTEEAFGLLGGDGGGEFGAGSDLAEGGMLDDGFDLGVVVGVGVGGLEGGLAGHVAAGDLDAVEEASGAAGVDVVGGDAGEDVVDGGEDGGAVLDAGHEEGGAAGAAGGEVG